MSFTPIKDEVFKITMVNTVEPFLAALRTEGEFASFDGKEIHYEYYIKEDSKANVVFCHGFTESAEKFREVYYYFINEGYNVFAVDHRGHGKSYRIPASTPNTVKINLFTDYVDDFNEFINQIVKQVSPELPFYMYSHSMGGAIAIRYLETYTDVFSKAILSAPMVCANTGMPENVTKALCKAATAIGLGHTKVIGKGDFDPNQDDKTSNDTCKERFEYYLDKKIQNPIYRTSSPSFNWVKQAMLNTDYIIKAQNISKITAQVLLCQPETDKMVLPEYQDNFIALVKNGTKKFYRNAKHEIYNSTCDVLELYYPDLFEFLG